MRTSIHFCCFLYFLCSSFFILAQPKWEQFDIPISGAVKSVYSDETVLYVYNDGAFYKSDSSLRNWTKTNLPAYQAYSTNSFTDGTWHFIDLGSAILRAQEGDSEWEDVSPPIPTDPNRFDYYWMIDYQFEQIFVSNHEYLVRSKDAGMTWDTLLPQEGISSFYGMNMMASNTTTMFYAQESTLHTSFDSGNTWINQLNPIGKIKSIAATDNIQVVFTTNPNLIYISKDNFETYEYAPRYGQDFNPTNENYIFDVKGDTLLAIEQKNTATINGLVGYYSDDMGKSWNFLDTINPIISQYRTTGSTKLGSKWFFATQRGLVHIDFKENNTVEQYFRQNNAYLRTPILTEHKVWISTEGETFWADKTDISTWKCLDGSLPTADFCEHSTVKGVNPRLFKDAMVVANANQISYTKDEGSTWEFVDAPTPDFTIIGTTKNYIWGSNDTNIYRSPNIRDWEIADAYINTFVPSANTYFIIQEGWLRYQKSDTLYLSEDEGNTWEIVPKMNCTVPFGSSSQFLAGHYQDNRIWSCFENFLLEQKDGLSNKYIPQEWTVGAPFSTLSQDGFSMILGDSAFWVTVRNEPELYFSKNTYGHYFPLEPTFPALNANAVVVDTDVLYVSTSTSGLYRLSPFYGLRKNEPSKKVQSTLQLYPNPTRDQVTVQVDGFFVADELAELSIFDKTGKLIFEDRLTLQYYLTIDAKNYPSGVYTVRLRSSKGVFSGRFVKQ